MPQLQPVPVDEDLRQICRSIIALEKALEEWSLIESDDIFQRGAYRGGFDADEGEFTFSYYDQDQVELWFQIDMADVEAIASGSKASLVGREPD